MACATGRGARAFRDFDAPAPQSPAAEHGLLFTSVNSRCTRVNSQKTPIAADLERRLSKYLCNSDPFVLPGGPPIGNGVGWARPPRRRCFRHAWLAGR